MKIDLTNIDNIIFDLGKVLLNLDFDATINAFQKLGFDKDVLNRQQSYVDPIFYEMETGKTTPQKFRNRIREILKEPDLNDYHIDEAWNAMILDIPSNRVKMLQHLKLNHKIYLFSNTNQIHIDGLLRSFKIKYGFDFPDLFETAFYSFEINERKPDLSSYKKVIELAGINPKRTVFIDDLEKNTLSAKKAGFKTFWLKEDHEIAELF